MNATLRAVKAWVSMGGLLLAGSLLAGCENQFGTKPPAAGAAPGAAPRVAASPLPASTAPAPASPENSADILHSGDQITVTFQDVPNYQPMEIRIRDDGQISLPLGVSLAAAGKKVGELEKAIHDAYVPTYFVRLTVTVRPAERAIFVGGYVRAPGRYAYTPQMSVLKAIKVAGDFTEYANKRRVELTRGDGSHVVIDCVKARRRPELDLPVFPGDSIWVPQRII